MRSFLCIFFLCTGCVGYRSLNQPLSVSVPTFSVPVIPGDIRGTLRAFLIEEFVEQGGFLYVTEKPQYQLVVNIFPAVEEKIGYEYDQQPITGERIKRLVPNEWRRNVQAEVTLVDRVTRENWAGPIAIEGTSDYYCVNSNSLANLVVNPKTGDRQSVLAFSLGQLGSKEEAGSIAQDICYQIIAKKAATYFTRRR